MIYLIKDKDLFKVGFTDNIIQRMKAYNTHNPTAKLLDVKEGSREDESQLHTIFKEFHFKNEWFHYNDQVLIVWETYFKTREVICVKPVAEVSKDENHIKLFTKFLEPFYSLDSDNARKIFLWLCEHSNSGKVILLTKDRIKMASEINICPDTITNNLKKLKDANLIKGEKGDFIINPQVAWNGNLRTRKQLLEDENIQKTFSLL